MRRRGGVAMAVRERTGRRRRRDAGATPDARLRQLTGRRSSERSWQRYPRFPGRSLRAEQLLEVQTQGDDGDGTPCGVVSGVRDELVVEGEGEPADDLQEIVRLDDRLGSVGEPPVPELEAEATSSEV